MRALRHSLFTFFLLLTAMSFCFGGAWLWLGFGCLGIAAVTLDVFLPDDLSSHAQSSPRLMNTYLYLTLPLVYLNVFAFNWQMSPVDFLGIGAFAQNYGIDIFGAKLGRSIVESIGAYMSIGLLISASGTVAAHELVHRVWDKNSVIMGRWLLAQSLDTSFSIGHVYGHHANVAMEDDPASARKGEGFWAFFPRSVWGSNREAWQIEKKRIEKRHGAATWSVHNVFLRGQVMSLCVAGFYGIAQGAFGILSFIIVASTAKLYLELINYIEHYGLSRKKGEPISAQHSWNCNAPFSLYCLYNLPRHPHHHGKGHLPFWKLEANPGGPTLPFGYMTMILIALVPPFFKKLMDPRIP